MKIAGYLINTPSGLVGESGSFYDYVLAKDGLYIRAESKHLKATIPIAQAAVRGLAPLEPKIGLVHVKIPVKLFSLMLSTMGIDPENEF